MEENGKNKENYKPIFTYKFSNKSQANLDKVYKLLANKIIEKGRGIKIENSSNVHQG